MSKKIFKKWGRLLYSPIFYQEAHDHPYHPISSHPSPPEPHLEDVELVVGEVVQHRQGGGKGFLSLWLGAMIISILSNSDCYLTLHLSFTIAFTPLSTCTVSVNDS